MIKNKINSRAYISDNSSEDNNNYNNNNKDQSYIHQSRTCKLYFYKLIKI